jgi:hypothetical protein
LGRGRTSSCVPLCADAHLHSWRRRRDDRGAGRARVPLRARVVRRLAAGDNGLAGSLDGRRQSPVVLAGMGRAQRLCSDVRHRRVSLGTRDSPVVLRDEVLAPRRLGAAGSRRVSNFSDRPRYCVKRCQFVCGNTREDVVRSIPMLQWTAVRTRHGQSVVFERETEGQERAAAVGSSTLPASGTNTAKASKGHGGSAQPIRR